MHYFQHAHFFYIIFIIIIECNAYSVKEVEDGLLPQSEESLSDKEVQKEIKKANKINDDSLDEDINNPDNNHHKKKNTYEDNIDDLVYNGNEEIIQIKILY